MKTKFETPFGKRSIGGEELYRLRQGHALTIIEHFIDYAESQIFRNGLIECKTLQYSNVKVNVGVVEDEYFDGRQFCNKFYLYLK